MSENNTYFVQVYYHQILLDQQEIKRSNTPDVEVIESTEAGEKHSLMNVNVKGIKKNLAALKMFNELRPSPSFIVVTETWNQDLDQAQIPGELL